jgi:hypothetical protein
VEETRRDLQDKSAVIRQKIRQTLHLPIGKDDAEFSGIAILE